MYNLEGTMFIELFVAISKCPDGTKKVNKITLIKSSKDEINF